MAGTTRAPAMLLSTIAVASRPLRFLSKTCHRSVSNKSASTVAQLLDWKPAHPAHDVVVKGYVRSVRSMKSQRFVSLGDGSSMTPLQALVPGDRAEGLTVGAAVRLVGSWVSSPGSGQSHELHAQEVKVLGPSDAKTFPLQKKYQTPEYLRTMPHLRPRTPHNAALLRLRSEAIASLTQFFAHRSFTQTHPPIITSSDCEGAGEVFTVLPASQLSESGGERSKEEPFFRDTKYLTVSTQLHLEALAQAVGNVWSLSPTFRAEKSDTSRHLSEFYMLEAEVGFAEGLGSIMDLAEDMLRYLATNLYESRVVQELLSRSQHTGPDLAPQDEVRKRWEGLIQQSWPRVTYTEAISILSPKTDMFTQKPTWGEGLQSEHEKYLATFVGDGKTPVFVTDYPRDIKAFYMKQGSPNSGTESTAGNTPGPTVECFDLLVPELCEIMGGSMREHRLDQLLAAMRLHGIAMPPLHVSDGQATTTTPAKGPDSEGGALDWYLDLRRWGCPPHGGFGLGFDRLLSYLAGVQTVRDMATFPRWFGRCDC